MANTEHSDFEWKVPAHYSDPYFNLAVYKSAPDLYEACKEALELSHNPKVEKILIQVITKAEGGQ